MTPAAVREGRRLQNPALIAVVALVLLAALHGVRVQHLTSDTLGLLNGVGVIDHCLHAHTWSCGKAGFGSVGPSALLQYLPALAFKRLGMHYEDAGHSLIWLNTAAFALVLVLLWRTGRKIGDTRLAALLALVAVASPLLWYSNAGFGEGFGVLAVTSFACALVTRSNAVLLGITLWFASISKEPALPFLLALAFVVLRRPPAPGLPGVRPGQALGIAVGAVAALATNIGFNAFRAYEGPVSGARPLASSLRHIDAPAPTIAQKAEAAIGLFLAPNVGLLWFWPVALGCLALGLVAAWRRSPSLRRFIQTPAAGATIIFLLFVAGTASFVAPYGFVAFGPRYLVPWIPSFVLVALCEWDACAELLDRLGRRAVVAIGVATAVVVLAISQLAAFLNPDRVYAHFHAGGACVTGLTDVTAWFSRYGEVGSYYRCTRYLAWTKGPLLVNVDAELRSVTSAAYLLVYVVAVGMLVSVALAGPSRVSARLGSRHG